MIKSILYNLLQQVSLKHLTRESADFLRYQILKVVLLAMPKTEMIDRFRIYRVSQKSCPHKFFDFLRRFVWQDQLSFFLKDRPKLKVFFHKKNFFESAGLKRRFGLKYKSLHFSILLRKRFPTFLFNWLNFVSYYVF